MLKITNLSVVICTFNPNKKIFDRVLKSLQRQTLDQSLWELILVDNNSITPLSKSISLDWHTNSKILLEKKKGLFYARLFGVENASSPLIVFVDDDNVLDKKYLAEALKFHEANPTVGCFGGKSLPNFEIEPPGWFLDCGISLGCQEFGNDLYISTYKSEKFNLQKYPDKAPIGTGMVITKEAFVKYANLAKNSIVRSQLGRKGKSLISGEDNDIILTTIKNDYEIAYVPSLIVQHFIPKSRLELGYLSKMAFESNRSWVKVLNLHQILPWRPVSKLTYSLRCLKSFFLNKAFISRSNYIRWKGACGIFKGLSELNLK